MSATEILSNQLQEKLPGIAPITHELDQLTVEIPLKKLREICFILRDDPLFEFTLLLDIAGIDYLEYGQSEWETNSSTFTGFERGVEAQPIRQNSLNKTARFAVIYHLLSVTHNNRLRLRVFLEQEEQLLVDSVVDVWNSANWYEREAFDLYGIVFKDHPDLRRILTDYGFVGHPFRKDFPLIGNLEVRYDAETERVIYEPVSISPLTLVPKVIRTPKPSSHFNSEEK